ncbi:translationally-controlled tumor protein-like [Erinaceus europaeus]|uniref:Translationally-controlled tumor protein n=1 Tax=Erinaceus europaeus TaxID=9365 RepID=A0ABM3XKM4_ERIEU|nr:translationally-controlled tumor protein-like [Erinaceus europaeus]
MTIAYSHLFSSSKCRHFLPPAATVVFSQDQLQDPGARGEAVCGLGEEEMVSRTEDNIDDSLVAEIPPLKARRTEVPENIVFSDAIMNHNLQETSFITEVYKKYIKDYTESVKGKLEEQRPERVKLFMTGATKQIKCILVNFKIYQFFTDENVIVVMDCCDVRIM